MAERETYRSVVGVLLALAALGSVGLAMGGIVLANAVLVDAAVTLGLFAGMLVGVMLTQLTPLKPLESSVVLVPAEETSVDPTPVHVEGRSLASRLDAITRWRSVAGRAAAWLPDARERANSRFATAAAGLGATLFIRMIGPTQPTALTFTTAGVAVLILAAGAGLTAVVVRYLTGLNATALPEAEGLSRASRIAGWVVAGAGLTAIFQWLRLDPAVRIVDFAVIAINFSICYGLLAYQRAEDGTPDTGSLDLGALSVLGSRTNIFGSLLDAAQSQLGIDLRSSWALDDRAARYRTTHHWSGPFGVAQHLGDRRRHRRTGSRRTPRRAAERRSLVARTSCPLALAVRSRDASACCSRVRW